MALKNTLLRFSDEEAKQIEELKKFTGEKTASKAIMFAISQHIALVETNERLNTEVVRAYEFKRIIKNFLE